MSDEILKQILSELKDLKTGQAGLEADVKELKSDMKKVDLIIKGLWEDIVKGEARLEKHEQRYHQHN